MVFEKIRKLQRVRPRMHIQPTSSLPTSGRKPKYNPTATPTANRGTDKLSSREAEKDRFLVIPDFLWYFYSP